jgi:hypothetical protein
MTIAGGEGMSQPDQRRTSEHERQQAIDQLCEAFADDRLAMGEFEQRVELANRAETGAELRALLADLPSPQGAVARREPSAPDTRPAATPAPRRVPASRVPEKSLVVGILGGGTRRGTWTPARTTTAIGVLGGVSLDFRECVLPEDGIEVECYALMGGVEIIAPPGVHIECNGVGLLGGFDYAQDGEPAAIDAPVIRITGFAMMGGVDVQVREPGESERDAKKRRRALRKAQRRARRGSS